ncbi:MAG TPA: PAS domain S-box protein [Dehalococcoidia bacterium]|nr:PAS domain S-box protein [Dehalococcoidia bacterium]
MDKKSEALPIGWEEVAQALLRNAGLGIYIVQEGKFQYVNPLLQDLTGYTENELLGKYSLDLVHSEDREVVRKKAIENLKSKNGSVPYEYRLVKKNGNMLRVLEEVTSINYGGKRATMGSFTDISARKELEETIKYSEKRYRTILNEMQDGYFEVDLGGHVTFANNAVCRDLGYSKEELIGMSYKSFTAEDDIESVFRAFNGVYQTGMPNKGFYSKSHRKDGGQGFYETSVSLLRNNKGEIVGFGCVGRDITERKHAEEALQKSQERYRSLAENAGEAIFVVQDGMIKFMNPKGEELSGYSIEELASGPFGKFIHPDDVNLVIDRYAGRLQGEPIPQIYDFRILRKDGDIRCGELNAVPISWEDRPAVLCFMNDITERKKAEEALKQSEEKYRTILDEIGDAYFEVDLKGSFTFVNDQMTQHLQYSKEELLGMNYRTFTVPEEIKNVYEAYNRVYRTAEPGLSFSHKVIRKDGTRRISNVSISPLRNAKGDIYGFRGISRDITVQKRLEEEREALLQDIKRINQKLEEANKELQDFVYIASHDLREPLRKISSFGTLLQDSLTGKLNEDQQENFGFMIDGARRMQDMIDALLAYSRLTTKAKAHEWVDLNKVIEDLKKLELATMLDETRGTIHVPEPLPSVQADPSQMHQLFQNLIGNGLKFHKEGIPPEIIIHARNVENNMIRIEVEDNGIGIDENYHDQLFTMFKRLHSRDEYEGTGIGLASCKKIVERHGGDIGIRSTPGKGSTFWFTLPRERYLKED